MKCVRSVTYSVSLNGSSGRKFIPSRGLRQGDPLSPYLFIVCAEGLSALLNHANNIKSIKGVTVGRERLEVGHLLFADDSVLFGEATVASAANMKNVLTLYGDASGQRINYAKCLLYFSSNVDPLLKDQIGSLLEVRVSTNPESYLGLPTMVGRCKREAFQYYLDRFNKKTGSWGVRFLSLGGKEVLIKSVLQAISLYAMQYFLFPISLCRQMEQIMAAFWWRNQGSGKGIHWCSWSQLARPKSCGGLGFRNLSQFNISLLAKQGWKLIKQPHSFLAKVLKARYYPGTDFLPANLGSNPSYVWRSLWSAKGLIERGFGWRIGDGLKVNIWNDPWLPGLGDGRIRNHDIDVNYSYVSDLIDSNSMSWKSDIIHSLFDEDIANRILSIPLSKAGCSDIIVWRYDGSGNYSVKSGYRLLHDQLYSSNDSTLNSNTLVLKAFYKSLWAVNLPSKVKITLWKIIHNFLPTFSNLQSRRLNVKNICPFCHLSPEDVGHLMRDCSFVQQLLSRQGIHFSADNESLHWKIWVAHEFSVLDDRKRVALMVTFWAVWYARNKLVHDGGVLSVDDSFSFIQAFILENESVAPVQTQGIAVRQTRWIPPGEDVIKCNFNSSYDAGRKKAFSGILFRNNAGLIMASCTSPHWHVPNVFVAEALACWNAVTVARELGFHKVEFEGDSLTVIKRVNSMTPDNSPISPIVHDIKEKAKEFGDIWFGFVHREANNAAHVLAKEGRGVDYTRIWIEEAPPLTTSASVQDRICLNQT